MTSITSIEITRSEYKEINRALWAVARITLKGDRDEITAARLISHALDDIFDVEKADVTQLAQARLLLAYWKNFQLRAEFRETFLAA